ncbi:MAG TPA: response regulator [Acidobacteriaceae bacterium]
MLQMPGAWFAADGSNFDPGFSAPNERESTSRETRKPRILVVDDEKRIADTVAEILNLSGFEAVAAYDGWSALEAAMRFRPDYLLSDVLMPRMNGAELAITIRQSQPATKILLFSGQAGVADILQSAQDRGYAFDLLAKPVHPARLIERLREL